MTDRQVTELDSIQVVLVEDEIDSGRMNGFLK